MILGSTYRSVEAVKLKLSLFEDADTVGTLIGVWSPSRVPFTMEPVAMTEMEATVKFEVAMVLDGEMSDTMELAVVLWPDDDGEWGRAVAFPALLELIDTTRSIARAELEPVP